MTSPARDDNDRPAILGGSPVWSAGPPPWPIADDAVKGAISRAVADGSWGKYFGRHGDALVARLKADLHVEHAILCASGTAAVELALRGLGVGPGDEVILSAYDFPGNFNDVLAVGATPVLVDVCATDWQIDTSLLSAAVSSKTKAILISHLHGGMVRMEHVTDFARAHRLAVIEDACQATGAAYDGKPAGTWGDVGVFSFGGSKLLSAGRGGAVVTHRADVAQRIKLHTARGNEAYPLSELQAAALLPQFDALASRHDHRADAVRTLREQLPATSGLAIIAESDAETSPAYYKLAMTYDPVRFDGLSRDLFSSAMRAEGIALDPGFRALHLTHSARRFRATGDLSRARDVDARGLVLHHPLLLETEAAIDAVARAVDKIRRHATMIQSTNLRSQSEIDHLADSETLT